ncbi:MAG: hypothetical protein K2P84_00575 [Undibacterium sp.]|nr:hypothetical protein [Undibacterium sp.]
MDDATRAKNAEWMSYRDAYKTMLWFEKYGKAKNLIQMQLQIATTDKNNALSNLRLHLVGKNTHIDLGIDGAARATLPLLKSAYDDNAELVLNQKSGSARFRFRVSIVTRDTGIYEIAELRAACEQALAFLGTQDATAGGKKCLGVRLAFAKKDNIAHVELKHTSQQTLTLAFKDDSAIWPDDAALYRTTDLLFANAKDHAQLISRTSPVALVALFE